MTDPFPSAPPPEDDLGAAATLPSSRAADGDDTADGGGKGGGRRRRARRAGGRALVLVVLLAIVALALVPAVASAFAKTPKDRVGLSYGGGPIEGAHFQKIVEPGSRLFFNGFFDQLYLYPADQQNYIVSANPKNGSDPSAALITATTADRVQVGYQVAVYYRLNTDPDVLRAFHEQLGLKYSAYTTAGWNALIEDTIRQQLEAALQEQTRRYDVAELFGDVDTLLQIQRDVEASLSELLEAALGGQYFCAPTFTTGGECGVPTFVIKKIDIPTSVARSFEARRTAEIDIERREAEAQAIEVLSDALAEAGDDYVLLKAIESGQITFWVLPDGGVTIAAPDEATPPATPEATPDAGTGGG